MPKMIQQNELVAYECPNCGYITKDKRGEEVNCPKCTPDFSGWFKKEGEKQNE